MSDRLTGGRNVCARVGGVLTIHQRLYELIASYTNMRRRANKKLKRSCLGGQNLQFVHFLKQPLTECVVKRSSHYLLIQSHQRLYIDLQG